MSKYKRLSAFEREDILTGIAKRLSLKEIAETIGRSESTVFREIMTNSTTIEPRKTCAHCLKNCKIRQTFTNGSCPNFEKKICEKLLVFPHVCNNCEDKKRCRHFKRYYRASNADETAKKKRAESRKVPKFKPDEDLIIEINEILNDCVLNKGQGLFHIWYSQELIRNNISLSTLRRYIEKRYFDAKLHNLRRFVRYSRKKKKAVKRIHLDEKRLTGRTFNCYLEEIIVRGTQNVFQYDSVIGKITDKTAILTITHAETNFQMGVKIDKGISDSVNSVIAGLKEKLGERFFEIFQINVCDNGSEFEKFYLNESVQNHVKVFYADPYKSYHKAECERNHEFIRYVIPKSTSLDNITQKDLDLLFSHINSYIREALGGQTPYELFVKKFGEDVADLLNINKIDPKDVNLTASLL